MFLVFNPEIQALVREKGKGGGGDDIVLTFSAPFIICDVYNL